MTFKQLKFTNGDERIADVVDEEKTHMVVRAAMRIVECENIEEGYSYFAFRPFISFTQDVEALQLVHTNQLIVEAIPSKNIMKHYATAVKRMSKFTKLGATLEDFEMMDSEEMQGYIEQLVQDELEEEDKETRKLGENVIVFKPKDTMH